MVAQYSGITVLVTLASLFGFGLAHTNGLCYRIEGQSVTFYAWNFHNSFENSGGLIIDGITHNFTGILRRNELRWTPKNPELQCIKCDETFVKFYQVVTVEGLTNKEYSIVPTSLTTNEQPMDGCNYDLTIAGITEQPSMAPTVTPVMFDLCQNECSTDVCQIPKNGNNKDRNTDAPNDSLECNSHAIIVDPFDCMAAVEDNCVHSMCLDCGNQAHCRKKCRDYKAKHEVRVKCGSECAKVKGNFKCFADCSP